MTPPPEPSIYQSEFMAVVTTPVLLGVLWFGKGFLIPLVVAGLLLILTNAIVDRIESVRIGARHAPRWLAHILSFSITVLTLVLLGTILSAQAGEIEAAAPRYQDRANAILANLTTLFGAEVIEAARRAFAEIDLGAVASSVLDSLGGVLGGPCAHHTVFRLSAGGAERTGKPDYSHLQQRAAGGQGIGDAQGNLQRR